MIALLVPVRSWLANNNLPFMALRLVFFSIAVCFLSISLFFLVKGLNYGIDFEGGIVFEVELREDRTLADLRALKSEYVGKDFSVQPLGGDDSGKYYLVKIEIDNQKPGGGMTDLRKILSEEVQEIRRSELVGPAISEELRSQAVWALLFALFGILIYIALRFQWRFAVVALIALVHDVISIVGFYGLSGFEVNIATVAVVLTVAGYSINDTVVVLDRIRENLGRYKTTPLMQLYDKSLNETLGRTVMTSLTTIIALIAIVTLGRGVVQEFAWGLIWGVVVGTFSSIGLAVPLLSLMKIDRGSEV